LADILDWPAGYGLALLCLLHASCLGRPHLKLNPTYMIVGTNISKTMHVHPGSCHRPHVGGDQVSCFITFRYLRLVR
jgi:hypothetical protein